MCWSLGATSVKMIRDATSDPAHCLAVALKLLSPDSGNLSNHKMARGTRESIRSQDRNVVGSIWFSEYQYVSPERILQATNEENAPCKAD